MRTQRETDLEDEVKRLTTEIESLNAWVDVLESDDHEWYLQAKRIEKLEAALRWIDDEAYSLDAAEYCAREAIAEVNE